jgi:hypothetical protein
MLQQGSNQVPNRFRIISDNQPFLRIGLAKRAYVQKESPVTDRRNRLPVP